MAVGERFNFGFKDFLDTYGQGSFIGIDLNGLVGLEF